MLGSSRGMWRTVPEKIEANNARSASLGRLLAVVENYPNHKADQSFLRLQDELAGTENRIATVRRRCNEVVRAYDTTIRSFPDNILANMFGFARAEFFQAQVTF